MVRLTVLQCKHVAEEFETPELNTKPAAVAVLIASSLRMTLELELHTPPIPPTLERLISLVLDVALIEDISCISFIMEHMPLLRVL